MEQDVRIAKAKALIGEQFAKFRKDAQISQNALARMAKEAELVGKNRSYIREIEEGQANPTIEILANLLSLCGYDFEDFLRGFQPESIPSAHQPFHRMLSTILNSGSNDLIQGIRVNLEAISEKAVRIQRTRGQREGAVQATAALEPGDKRVRKRAG